MTDQPDQPQPEPGQSDLDQPELGQPDLDQPDLALRAAVLELERHAAEGGWDQPARLYALVHTEELVANEPSLVPMLGIEPDADLTGSLTPVEQDELPGDEHLEELLTELMWPPTVHGAAVAVERIVLPATVELPDDEEAAREVAVSHPERQEVRMVAGATRGGTTYCAMRLRSHDEAASVLEGPDLVPALLELLLGTLASVDLPEDSADLPEDEEPR